MTVEFEIEILLFQPHPKKNVWLWAKRIMEFTTANKREMSGVETQRVVTDAQHTRFRYIGHLHIKICSTTRMLLCLFPSSRLSNIPLNAYTLCLKVYIILFRLNSTSPWSRSFHLYLSTVHIAQWHRQFVFFHLLFFIVHGNDTIIGNFIRWWEESLREWKTFAGSKSRSINK